MTEGGTAAAQHALEQRVLAARSALRTAEAQADAPVEEGSEARKLAQWYNWGNWGNWGNWPNWQNWGNWFNR